MTTAQAPSAIALQDQARALDLEAREHKRLEAFHRRRARDARQRLARVEAACQALGIRLVIHGHSPTGGTDR